MFTKKPEASPGSVPSSGPGAGVHKPAERPAPEMSAAPAASERSGSFVKGASKSVPTIIGEDLTITGNVVTKGEIQVDGEIQGDVHCGSIVVGEKAAITGGIVADEVTVRGRVTGSIRGFRVSLQSNSHVEGDIFHQSLAIEQGAYFEGKSRRSDDPVSAGKSSGPQKVEHKTQNQGAAGGGHPHAAA